MLYSLMDLFVTPALSSVPTFSLLKMTSALVSLDLCSTQMFEVFLKYCVVFTGDFGLAKTLKADDLTSSVCLKVSVIFVYNLHLPLSAHLTWVLLTKFYTWRYLLPHFDNWLYEIISYNGYDSHGFYILLPLTIGLQKWNFIMIILALL